MKPVVPGGNDNFFPPVPPDEPVINFTKYFPKYGVILLLQETSEQELNDLSSELPSDTHRVTFRYPSGAVSTDAVRSHSMGDIFDAYHDSGLQVLEIASGHGSIRPNLFQNSKKDGN